jgi:hypothetical protein
MMINAPVFDSLITKQALITASAFNKNLLLMALSGFENEKNVRWEEKIA